MVKTKVVVMMLVVLGVAIGGMVGWYVATQLGPAQPQALQNELIGQLTGKDGFNDTTLFNVMGTDLGIVTKYQGQFRYIFGDTFGTDFMTIESWDPLSLKDYAWRSQTMALSNDTDPSDGILLNDWITDPISGNATELFPSRKDINGTTELTCIATTAVTINTSFYIFYMSVRSWGSNGHNWVCNNASIAYSADGELFTKIENVSWPGLSNCIQFAFVQDNRSSGLISDEIYFLTAPGNRYGGAYLVKVHKNQLLNQSAYRYLSLVDANNTPVWSSNMNAAKCVISPTVGELSVMWDKYLEKYVVTYTDIAHSGICLRVAEHLWGPWSAPYLIAHARDYPGLYSAFLHPDLVENNGQQIYFIMSRWSVYNTFVMRVDLTILKNIQIQTLGLPCFLFGVSVVSVFRKESIY
jgi:hypothetical protein